MPQKNDPKLLATVERSLKQADSLETLPDSCAAVCAPGGGNRWLANQVRLTEDVWEPFLLRAAAKPALELRARLQQAARRCESPIEELMFLALVVAGQRDSTGDVIVDGREPEPFERDEDSFVSIQPQVPIGKYRVDLQVVVFTDQDPGLTQGLPAPPHREWRRGVVLVECDGHDFHERTKEQASHDKRKDRELQRLGFTVFRYTGSDVWRDCAAAAAEVVEHAHKVALQAAPIATEQPKEGRP